jgi:3',5'-cyclic AMP phosphodiesterase CpdA
MAERDHGTTRRHTLECMAWAGTGLVWAVAGGVPRAELIGSAAAAEASFTFAQISDSHIGFARDPNMDTPATLSAGIGMVRAMARKPALVLHTGDVSHLSKPAEFDTAEQIIGASGFETHYVPGEHDVLDAAGTKPFVQRFQGREKQGADGGAFYSFDAGGLHFVGLNNVVDLKAGGLGNLGAAQLAWLEKDLAGRTASTPVVVFAHIPLWTVYETWGWGTDDGARALALLKRFGSVTVLNGHIHQVLQKVEGTVAFHTARSTAFPQPAPGSAPSPGPMKVEAGKLRDYLGVASISVVAGQGALAIVDTPLGA